MKEKLLFASKLDFIEKIRQFLLVLVNTRYNVFSFVESLK